MGQSHRMSMTGFAAQTGASGAFSWSFEIRSVNAKGLDIRLRVPDWVDGLEAGLRAAATKVIGRGNVQVALRISREEGAERLSLNRDQLAAVITALAEAEAAADAAGVVLKSSSAADLLGLRGVLETTSDDDDAAALLAPLIADFQTLLASFNDMRGREGAELAAILTRQIDEIAALIDAAKVEATARAPEAAETLKANLAKVLSGVSEADPDRVAQELALIAVKADVAEEIDRLMAHVAQARDLLGQAGPVGRKLDFLMQEFNREANTLCSKSGSTRLTRIGLDLKVLIDQMREQVQNVE